MKNSSNLSDYSQVILLPSDIPRDQWGYSTIFSYYYYYLNDPVKAKVAPWVNVILNIRLNSPIN